MPHTPRSRATAVLAALTLTVPLAACGSDDDGGGGSTGDCTEATSITIAYQPGLGYANLRLIKADKLLEKELAGVTLTWRELNSGAAIRDGVVAGEIQLAAGGVGPFIIGRGAGVKWKTIAALNAMNLQLMVKDPNITSLEQLKGDGKIAMPGPDSIQSIVLRKAAQDELGDAKALDSQILAMGHPDGVQALIAGQIAAHLTSPPFQQQEADQGAKVLLNSFEVFDGSHTFNGLYALEDFIACNPKVMPALLKTLDAANTEINDNTEKAAATLATEIGGMEADAIAKQLTAEGTEFTTQPTSIGKFASFMKEIGLIREDMGPEDMFFENDATKDGS